MGLAFAGECSEWRGAGWQHGPRALVHGIEAEPSGQVAWGGAGPWVGSSQRAAVRSGSWVRFTAEEFRLDFLLLSFYVHLLLCKCVFVITCT